MSALRWVDLRMRLNCRDDNGTGGPGGVDPRIAGTIETIRLRCTHPGLRLERFYEHLGWREIGRWPGALRLAPDDDRDEILMCLLL